MLRVAAAAAARIEDSGGDLYFWAHPLGGGFDVLKAAWARPAAVEFAAWPAEAWRVAGADVAFPPLRRVLVEVDFDPPPVVRIEFHRLPRAHLTAAVRVDSVSGPET